MQDTVAVALITALSTLFAAGLTGAITLRLQRRQAAAERVRAREEARRAAYAGLLAASTETWFAIDAMWRLVPPQNVDDPMHPEAGEVLSALKRLDHALHVACLHGPSSIDTEAAELYFYADKEFGTIMQVLDGNIGDSRRAVHCAIPSLALIP
ncbi:hypothetical protein [Streptomyces sp. AcE210]|uniref:hypothetical protein n=1 Tax=Streptomyces sp. AcE210 TaxID=2292703 RepID=UPI000E30AF29|nr:hypothetical protein [Streptomyces sp. AcE210]RFC78084.1 hypothetical protein DXZ75_09980 [Streptomyces sp. AcE210]